MKTNTTNYNLPITSEGGFIRLIRQGINPLTREQFHETSQVGGLWDKLKEDDIRRTTLKTREAFYDYCYDILTSDEPLRLYFQRRLVFSDITDVPNVRVENRYISTASNRNNVRPIRNINLETMLDVKAFDGVNLKGAYKEGLETGKVLRAFTMPSIFKTAVTGNYDSLVVCLKTCTGQPSVFSPTVYRALLHELEKHASRAPERLLVPSASWGTPVLAASDIGLFGEIHIVDVMEPALKTCQSLHQYISDTRTAELFAPPMSRLETTRTRSEVMSNKVPGSFDRVFFCPPYYDLELYPGAEQSTEVHQSYTSWLHSYWEATVLECKKMLNPGGVFSFVMGRTIRGHDMGEDMARIAEDSFTRCEEIEIAPGKESRRDSNKVKKSECCYIFRHDG